MKTTNKMLLGISILVITILIHLGIQELMLTDFIGIIGVIVIIDACCKCKDDE